ncbi:hypothetical protein VNO80_20635 [Phaseolus coccineus]|uniref:Uncharacterized protein n=1 Tax=Phaseolus coccineus TaxID=3886 RepID=A0AAN9M0X1_PHACN
MIHSSLVFHAEATMAVLVSHTATKVTPLIIPQFNECTTHMVRSRDIHSGQLATGPVSIPYSGPGNFSAPSPDSSQVNSNFDFHRRQTLPYTTNSGICYGQSSS